MLSSMTVPAKSPGENGRQYAYRVLYGAIMNLELPPGTVLVDGDLSNALNISRTPIREAIVSLVEAKLVDVYPQRSSCVSRIDLDAIEEGIFLRFNAERAILKLAAVSASGRDISLLHENLEQQRQCLESSRPEMFFELDNDFHRQLYILANKPWTWSAVMRTVTHLNRVRRLQMLRAEEQLWTTYEEHLRIFNAIMAHDTSDMDDFLYGHLTAGYRNALPELMKQYPDYFSI